MKISVCVVTARPGGIDCLLTGLANQEFDHNEFEIVLVDALYDRRRDLVGDLFAEEKLICRHVPPRERIFPVDACPQARNTAIAKARGELLVWLVDYSVLPSKALEEHWGVFEYFNKERAGMAAHRYLFPPPLAYVLPDYAPMKVFKPNETAGITYAYDESHSRAFVEDLMAGFYDPYMYSIFQRPVSHLKSLEELHEDLFFFRADPKLTGMTGGSISGNFLHCKAESTPHDLVLEVNGFDEGYWGHCYDDTDFGHRMEHAGAKWILLDQAAMVDIVNPRHIFPHLVRRMQPDEQRDLYDQRMKNMAYKKVDQYSLSMMKTLSPWWY